MKELSLFTGAGGGVLGSKLLGWEAVGYVEWDKYCQEVLAKRIEDGFLDEAPIFGDIDEFIKSGAAKKYEGFVDVVTAGFPCQPFSVAGKKRGQDDERNKWPQTLECIRLIRPRYALLENVPGLLNSGYFGEILSSLGQSGFDVRWDCISAAAVGAPHRRDRLWILAKSQHPDPNSIGSHREEKHFLRGVESNDEQISLFRSVGQVLADTESERHGRRDREERRDEGWNLQQSEQAGSEVASEVEGRCGSRREDVADSSRSRFQARSGDRMGTEHGSRGNEGQSASAGGKAVVADSDSPRFKQGDEAMAGGSPEQSDGGSVQPREGVSHPNGPRLQGRLQDREFDSEGWQVESDGCAAERGTGWEGSGNEHWWSTEPNVGRVAHGVASRVDRLKALGNGQVPLVAATAWLLLKDL